MSEDGYSIFLIGMLVGVWLMWACVVLFPRVIEFFTDRRTEQA